MGFGKFLLGGVCAVGAVIAAPVVLPTLGTVSLAAGGMGVAGTVASMATAAGAAGVAAGAVHEKMMDNKCDEARREGYNKASRVYKDKFAEQEKAFNDRMKAVEKDSEEYYKLIDEYIAALKAMQEELNKQNNEDGTLEEEKMFLQVELEKLNCLRY